MKIPFDIKYKPQIESGEYEVVTRDESPARIICWDRHATEPFDGYILVALVTLRNNSESAYYYYSDGHLWNKSNGEGDSQLDLFLITPEPELTPFEQHLLVYFQKVYYAHCESQDVNDFLIRTIKQSSKGLLEFAKKEIYNRYYIWNSKGLVMTREEAIEVLYKIRDLMREQHRSGFVASLNGVITLLTNKKKRLLS